MRKLIINNCLSIIKYYYENYNDEYDFHQNIDPPSNDYPFSGWSGVKKTFLSYAATLGRYEIVKYFNEIGIEQSNALKQAYIGLKNLVLDTSTVVLVNRYKIDRISTLDYLMDTDLSNFKLSDIIWHNDLELFKYAKDHGALVYMDLLMNIVNANNLEIFKYMVDSGLDDLLNNEYVLYLAERQGCYEIFKYGYEHGLPYYRETKKYPWTTDDGFFDELYHDRYDNIDDKEMAKLYQYIGKIMMKKYCPTGRHVIEVPSYVNSLSAYLSGTAGLKWV